MFPAIGAVVVAAALLVPMQAPANHGALDSSFARDGTRTIGVVDRRLAHLEAVDAVRQGHGANAGKLVIAARRHVSGNSTSPAVGKRIVLVRLHPNGRLDTSFGRDGFVQTSLSRQVNGSQGAAPRAITRDTNDRLVVAGTVAASPPDGRPGVDNRVAVMRLTANGRLDRTFGDLVPAGERRDGVATVQFGIPGGSTVEDLTETATSITRLSNGDYVVGAQAILRDSEGTQMSKFRLVVLRNTGGIRVLPPSSLIDFAESGGLTFDTLSDVVRVSTQDHVVAVGTTLGQPNSGMGLARLSGQPDLTLLNQKRATFGIGPNQVLTSANAVAPYPGGRVVMAGGFGPRADVTDSKFAIYLTDLDFNGVSGFGGDGFVTTAFTGPFTGDAFANDVIVDGGRVIAGGVAETEGVRSAFALSRYLSNGQLDAQFGDDGRVATVFRNRNARAEDLVRLPDGFMYAVGTSRAISGGSDDRPPMIAVARYHGVEDTDVARPQLARPRLKGKRKVTVKVAVDEAARVRLSAKGKAGGRKLSLKRKTVRLKQAGQRKVGLKLRPSARRRLAKLGKGKRVRVTIKARARDSAGHNSSGRLKKALRRR